MIVMEAPTTERGRYSTNFAALTQRRVAWSAIVLRRQPAAGTWHHPSIRRRHTSPPTWWVPTQLWAPLPHLLSSRTLSQPATCKWWTPTAPSSSSSSSGGTCLRLRSAPEFTACTTVQAPAHTSSPSRRRQCCQVGPRWRRVFATSATDTGIHPAPTRASQVSCLPAIT